MDWNVVKNNGYKEVDGNRQDLTHLSDCIYNFTINATEKYPSTDIDVLVQYSSHCVSWGSEQNQEIDFSIHGEDRRVIDDKGNHRCFCDSRYELSKKLPEIFSSLLRYKCFFTGRENWLIIEIIDSFGNRDEYEIFFNLTRQGKKMLRLYVESAYVRDEHSEIRKPANFKHRDKIRASVLLMKKLRGDGVRRPRR